MSAIPSGQHRQPVCRGLSTVRCQMAELYKLTLAWIHATMQTMHHNMQIGLIGGINPAAQDFYTRRLIGLFADADVPLGCCQSDANSSLVDALILRSSNS